ncbi:MAG TPA: PadR family transcriptional regulator [Microbacterium sp.]|nr:PadR family transcriptional regulator [Microbacterium sp.]
MSGVHHVILGLLLDGPLSLYDLQKRFAGGLAHFYSASSGSIERALRQIVAVGHAVIEDDPDSRRRRRVYRITPDGAVAWREWMHAPTARGADAETTALAKVFLLGRVADAGERREVLAAIRGEAETSAARLRALARDLDAQSSDLDEAARALFAPQRATLAYGLRAHDTLITWLRECEADFS